MAKDGKSAIVPAAVLALELGGAAGGLAELMSYDVALSERACDVGAHTTGQLLVPLGLLAALVYAALLLRERAGKPTLEASSRALLPLLALLFPLARERFVEGGPFFAEPILAPIFLGAAIVRGLALARPRSTRFRRTLVVPVAIASFLVALGFAVHALGLLDGLALGHHDAGDHAVRLENTIRGSFLKCDPGHAAFWDHLNPGVALLAPFYAVFRPIFPGTRFTTVAQAVVLAGTALVAYGLARRRLSDPVSALLLALAYLATPALIHLNVAYSYGFHTVTLTLPMLFGAAWAYGAGRTRLALGLVLLSWACEETLAPATFGMGLSLALAPRTRRHGAILAASSLAYFFLATKVILPLVNGSGYFCTGYYPHLGSSISEIVVSPLVRPRAFWGTLLEPATFGLLFGLLAPWLLLPLAKPRWLLAAAPVLAFACLRTDIFFKSITHWHHTNVFAWIFLALVDSARSPHAAWVLGIRCRGRARARALAGGALGAAVFGALLYGDEPFGKTRRPFSPRPGQGAIVRELASSFPKDAQIVATERAAAHVVPEHPDVRILRPDLERGADLVYLLDLQDSWGLPSIPRLRKDMKVLRRDGYGVARSRGNFVVLEKGAPRASATDIVDAPPGPPVARFEEAGLTLLSISRLSEDRARLIWRVDRKTEGDWFLVPTRPGARPDIDDLAGDFYAIGPATRPTYERAEGEAFSEERILEIPEKEPLRLHVFDFLEVDARGERMGEVIARCRLRAVRRK